jgi:ribosomal-protein-alanine N-acetyltransferase
MIYELLKQQLHVLNFAVAPWSRRQCIGAQMVDKLVHKLSQQRRHEIVLEVRESNLQAQLFFRSQGLLASSVLRGFYEDTEEDAYQMKYLLERDSEIVLPLTTKNRISELFEGRDNRAA